MNYTVDYFNQPLYSSELSMKKFGRKRLTLYFGLLSIFCSNIAFSDPSVECVRLDRQFEELSVAYHTNPSTENGEGFKNLIRNKLSPFAEDANNALEDRIFLSLKFVGFVSRLNPSFNRILDLTAQGLVFPSEAIRLLSAKSILVNFQTALQGPQDPRLKKAFTTFMELLESNSLSASTKLRMIDFLEEFRDSPENKILIPEIVSNVPNRLSFIQNILQWRTTGNANDIMAIDKYLMDSCNTDLHKKKQ